MDSQNGNFDPMIYICQAYQVEAANIRVEILEGGITNLTCRVTFNTAAVAGLPMSLILKFAAPYNFREGPNTPLSVYRQTIEARALEYLSGQSNVNLPLLPTELVHHSLLLVPRLIKHDVGYNVLLITDLGRCKTMSDWLLSGPPVEAASRIAERLASFLLLLYEATLRPSAKARQHFDNPDSHGRDFQILLGQLCRRFLKAAALPDAEELATRVESGELVDKEDVVLAMKDLWAGAAIVNEKDELCLVDFEYFGQSNEASELGMFRMFSSATFRKLIRR